ncbi:outer envelope pore protein 16-3, chloroplastic/mitochondrial isoform X1 [Gossypium hirsutum]|uniref:Outer envelope pore protein 16-3, chloroplastic/mitochondrial isoform X1 n=1 Tax=Gossypium hirsutum TaxID=3635 RepID=A0A1U8HTT6_GOSHI|nr:outer envelope pore protein 16-3, chloroplastic/mitochondrial isoform X1 [Gossypium hirsutum]
MDPSELRYYEDDDTPTMKTIKGATTGFVAGTIWGTVVATWYDVPRVERSVALPGLVRTLKMMGNYGMTFAAIGGVYIGVEQLLQNYRMKRSFVNGAVGGFVAGASILGFKVIWMMAFLESFTSSKLKLVMVLWISTTIRTMAGASQQLFLLEQHWLSPLL